MIEGPAGTAPQPWGGWLQDLSETVSAAAAAPEAEPLAVVAVRLGAALLLGAMLGIERQRRSMPAGLRTHMLVSLASALSTTMALEIAAASSRLGSDLRVDPTRVIEAVTAGVAFLAAGAIIRGGRTVKGLTTGAGLWMAGAIGVSCGLGFLSIAAGSTLAAIVILAVIRQLEP